MLLSLIYIIGSGLLKREKTLVALNDQPYLVDLPTVDQPYIPVKPVQPGITKPGTGITMILK